VKAGNRYIEEQGKIIFENELENCCNTAGYYQRGRDYKARKNFTKNLGLLYAHTNLKTMATDASRRFPM
jgi:hypothetical protein